VRFKYALAAVKMAASMCRKHKQVVLSLENKLSILDRLAKGQKATKVASEFGIGNSMVTHLKKESRIQSFVSSMKSLSICSKECKIMHLADDEKWTRLFTYGTFKKGAKEYRLQGLF